MTTRFFISLLSIQLCIMGGYDRLLSTAPLPTIKPRIDGAKEEVRCESCDALIGEEHTEQIQHLQAMNSPIYCWMFGYSCGEDGESDHVYTREKLEGLARGDLRKLYKSKGVSSDGKKEDYITRFMTAQVAGFPSKQPPKSRKERKDKQIANETPKKRHERQAKDAEQKAGKRAADKAASIQPTLDNMVSDVPGNDYDFETFTEDPISACRLFGVNSGGWAEFGSKRLIAFVHVMNRLLDGRDASAIHKLNGLLELSVERYETFAKTTEQVFNTDDTKAVLDYQHQVRQNESREMDFEEEVLEWYATNDIVSLEDRKSKLPTPWLESLVGLQLEVPSNPGKIDHIDYTSKEGKFYIFKSDGEDYPITYSTVKQYNSDKNLDLPKDEPYINFAFNVRCETTLQELRVIHSSMSADCESYLEKAKILYKHAIREIGVYIDTQLVTPERAQELILKYSNSQGLGLSWAPDEKDKDSARLLTCGCCGVRGMNNGRSTRSYHEVDLSDAKIQSMLKLRDEVDDEEKDGDKDSNDTIDEGNDGKVQSKSSCWTRQDHRQAMNMDPLSIPYNNDGDTKEVETWRLKSVWPARSLMNLKSRENLSHTICLMSSL